MRIAVTGASGVIGRGVVLRLLSAGHDVAGFARRRPESWPSEATFVPGDVRDAATVQRAVAGAEVAAFGQLSGLCRAIPVTSWPELSRRRTTPRPTTPLAPVTAILMG